MVAKVPALTPTTVANLVRIRDALAERIVRLERSMARAQRDLAAIEETLDVQPDQPGRVERARFE